MSGPRVSVVVNNFNYERYLGEAIDSALAQDHDDVEVVVVDDGSTDGSADVVRAYGSRVVPVLKPNGGQGSAFNAGFAAATGDGGDLPRRGRPPRSGGGPHRGGGLR